MSLSNLVRNLRPGLYLCADTNPWGYNPLELTVIYEMIGYGRPFTQTAQIYFEDSVAEEGQRWLVAVREKSSRKIYALGPKISIHHFRTRRHSPGRRTAPNWQLWQNLLTEDPLILSEKWAAEFSIPRGKPRLGATPRKPASTNRVDDFGVGEKIRQEKDEKQAKQEREAERFRRREDRRQAIELMLQQATAREQVPSSPTVRAPKPAWEEPKPAPIQPTPVKVKPVATPNSNGVVPPKTNLPRTCPRCRGSMIHERDWYGVYATCICCGYVHDLVSGPPINVEEENGKPYRQRRRSPSHGKIKL